MCCFITFKSSEAEGRFKKWVVRGNERSEAMGLTTLGLKAKVLKIEDSKYLFMWEHLFFFNMTLFLRFMLWMQLRKVRKDVSLKSVNKLEFVDLVLSQGLRE